MSDSDRQYSIAELEELTGQPRRTIHHYISTGLLAKAEGKGPSAYYTHEHYLRLRLISLLAEAGLRPELIQKSLQGWSQDDMERLVHVAEGQTFDDLDKIGRWLSRSSQPPAVHSAMLADDAPASAPAKRIAEELHLFQERVASPAPKSVQRSLDMGRRAASRDSTSSDIPSEASIDASLAASIPYPDVKSGVVGSPRKPRTPLPRPAHWERIRIGDKLEISYHVKTDRLFGRKIHELKEFLRHLFAEEIESEHDRITDDDSPF